MSLIKEDTMETFEQYLLFKIPHSEPYEWQKNLIDIIDQPPNSRRITWIHDTQGNNGKSFMTSYFHKKKGAFVTTACAREDLMYMYGETNPLDTLIICDIPRSQLNPGIYTTLENIKNGVIKHSKYQGVDKKRDSECHVIVFSNELPDLTKWSQDRYHLFTIMKDKTMV